jgi:hypothetical protein
MRIWHLHTLVRVAHTAVGLAGIGGACLLARTRADRAELRDAFTVVMAVLALWGAAVLLQSYLRSIELTEEAIVVRNWFSSRRFPLRAVVAVAPDRSGLRIDTSDGSSVRALAVGMYHWMAPGHSRAERVSAELNDAAERARAGIADPSDSSVFG